MIVPCLECHKPIDKFPSYFKNKAKVFCSSKCSGDNRTRRRVERICKYCKNTFYVVPSVIKGGKGSFCSHKCQNAVRGGSSDVCYVPRVKRNCKVCGKEFEFKRSRLNYGKYTNEFCSVICKGIAKSIPKVERVCEFCKSTFFVQRSALKNNPSRFCSHKCADTHNRGWNNVKFKDASSEAEKLRKSPAYINWRTTVFIRDGKKCVFCGSKKDIEADHIKPRYLFPELTLELTNGRTLCHDCHSKTPTYMNGYMKREDFVEV